MFLGVVVFLASCGNSNRERTIIEEEIATIEEGETRILMGYRSNGKSWEIFQKDSAGTMRYYVSSTMEGFKSHDLLHDKILRADSITFDVVQWASKDYEDFKIEYLVKGEHSYGNNLGGWERKYRYIELMDGETGKVYLKMEPYSYSFEEHNITGDTTHPLAATSCHFQYEIEFVSDKDEMRVSDLQGSCLPDFEEGLYKFKDNELVLTKE